LQNRLYIQKIMGSVNLYMLNSKVTEYVRIEHKTDTDTAAHSIRSSLDIPYATTKRFRRPAASPRHQLTRTLTVATSASLCSPAAHPGSFRLGGPKNSRSSFSPRQRQTGMSHMQLAHQATLRCVKLY